ncbi:MAG: acetate--CoA ligase family protein [Bacteroidales bacterium]|nr:acetate--CoA ligase family protein [Bacteroidales bacterium]
MIRIPAITSENLIVSQNDNSGYPPVDKEIIHNVIDDSPAGMLSADKALRLLDAIGLSHQKEIIATTIIEAKIASIDIGYPVNMRSISMHEDGETSSVINVTDENTMRLEFKRLMLDSDVKGVLISPSLEGERAYFGIRHRAKFGHIILCGTYPASDQKPCCFAACTMPVSKAEATEAMERVQGSFQLNKILFVDTLRRLSALCSVAPRIESMDIMPVVASTRSVVALDISVVLS